eukprot:5594694-Alexandrium_andersonii.AAC.1
MWRLISHPPRTHAGGLCARRSGEPSRLRASGRPRSPGAELPSRTAGALKLPKGVWSRTSNRPCRTLSLAT